MSRRTSSNWTTASATGTADHHAAPAMDQQRDQYRPQRTTWRPAGMKTDAYAVASLHLGMHKLLDERLSFYVDVYNLFDRRYYNARLVEHGDAASASATATLMGTVEYHF